MTAITPVAVSVEESPPFEQESVGYIPYCFKKNLKWFVREDCLVREDGKSFRFPELIKKVIPTHSYFVVLLVGGEVHICTESEKRPVFFLEGGALDIATTYRRCQSEFLVLTKTRMYLYDKDGFSERIKLTKLFKNFVPGDHIETFSLPEFPFFVVKGVVYSVIFFRKFVTKKWDGMKGVAPIAVQRKLVGHDKYDYQILSPPDDYCIVFSERKTYLVTSRLFDLLPECITCNDVLNQVTYKKIAKFVPSKEMQFALDSNGIYTKLGDQIKRYPIDIPQVDDTSE